MLSKCTGRELVGLRYAPLFDYFSSMESAFRVVCDGYVTNDSGTGVVHQVRPTLCSGGGVTPGVSPS